MLDSKKLNDMICDKYGSVAAFSRVETSIPYTTIKYSLACDERVGKMPVNNFITLSKRLDMKPEVLYEYLLIEGTDD